MKSKTIKSIIRKKVNEWLSTLPEQLRKKVENNVIVTGGAITSLLMNDKVNDFDIYFKNQSSCFEIAKYYVDRFKENPPSKFKNIDKKIDMRVNLNEETGRISIVVQSSGIIGEDATSNYQYFETVNPNAMEAHDYVERAMDCLDESDDKKDKPKYRPIFLTSNAITLSDKIQLIIRFYGDAKEIHSNYDFVHCMNYWDSETNELVLRQDSLECIMNKELRYHGSKYPICSLIRSRKFIERGWTINAGQYLKMAWQIHELDLHDINVLQDQLVGVDCAYFMEVINLLKQYQSDNNTKDVDSTYLCEIIDKVF